MIDSSMQQFTFVAANKLEWREVTAPKIESAGQAIVRPLAVTRCDLDLYVANGTVPMKDKPFAFGHEIAGEVVEIGDDVTRVIPSDKVVVPFQINCGTCEFCQQGYTNACSSVPRFSAYGLAQSSGRDWGGGLSDFVLVPYADAMLVKIPQAVSLPVAASISDNASDGYRTVARPLKERPGSPVLIVGGMAQSVGLFAVQAAVALGASKVTYTDFGSERLAHAKSLGAEAIEVQYGSDTPVTEQFPIVVDASSLREGLIYALRSTQAYGICTGVSAPGRLINGLPVAEMYMKGITYEVSRVHARAKIEAVLDCSQCGKIKHLDVITRILPFSEAQQSITDPDTKIVFVRDEQ
ncbi:alcohol dehydrogenase catalytic domain-containing protein [Sphingorhabdus sp. Alg231-15]|uniref:alcohol dehydrogenase catalytic domain-containing protein n=1 Tax=Sphingorhabdus sp. Alg231-15 TaxID=1922222 RepID=UPI000D556EFC